MDRKRKLDLGDAANGGDAGPSGSDAGDDGGGVSPYTGRPYTKRYYEILKTRKGKGTG